MALIRRFEERAAELFQQGVIVGTAHSCVGQEAIAVGAASAMRETDYLVGHHRSHGHLIAAGADLRRMMAEMFGKRTGYCRGPRRLDAHRRPLARHPRLQRHRRRRDPARLRRRADREAARHRPGRVAYFGDGAAGQGAVHEGMNLAATWRLPVVFICENNQYALSADWRTQRAVEDIADRAAGYGMPGEVVDGNDVAAVEEAVARALDAGARRRRADAARAEDVPPDAALDAREPARRARPRRLSRSGRRATRCRGSRRELDLDDDALAEVEARRRAPRSRRRSSAALADEDASAGRPAAVGLRRAPPLPRAARRRASARSASSPRSARRSTLELAADRRRDRDRRGHRPRRRPLPRDRGAVRALRRRADPRHAADRERLRRLRRSARRSPGCGRSSSCSSPTSPASRSTRS